jgi:hypothetical protein
MRTVKKLWSRDFDMCICFSFIEMSRIHPRCSVKLVYLHHTRLAIICALFHPTQFDEFIVFADNVERYLRDNTAMKQDLSIELNRHRRTVSCVHMLGITKDSLATESPFRSKSVKRFGS